MEEINAVTPEQINNLRRKFEEKVSAQSPGFHPKDLERVKSDELWMRRFIAHAESNIELAVTLLYECCQWRKDFQTNDLDETKLPADILNKGTLFIRGKDKWGKKLLIFKAKTQTKGSVSMELLQKLVVYYFERIERESKGDQISIIFDMANTGWSNMDLDFVQYLITLLKMYYPYFVNYLIIFEMPWLLNAAWKIIKGWLPPKFVDRVKFQDKKTLKEFIDADNQLSEWGGNDNYVFKFEPASKNERNVNNNNNENASRSKTKAQITERIESSDIEGSESRATPMVTPSPSGQNCLIDVGDRIIFRPSDYSNDQYAVQLFVKNISPNGDTLIIKIKTTSPDRYKVKPIIFILSRHQKGIVNIETCPGVSASTMFRDRFQVQVAPIPQSGIESESDVPGGDLGIKFKQIVNNGTTFEMYRVNVGVEARPGDTGPAAGDSIALSDERLRRGLEDLEKKITESVAKRVTAKMTASEKVFKITLGVIAVLLIINFLFLVKLSGDCSKSCAGITSSSSWVSNAGESCDSTNR